MLEKLGLLYYEITQFEGISTINKIILQHLVGLGISVLRGDRKEILQQLDVVVELIQNYK